VHPLPRLVAGRGPARRDLVLSVALGALGGVLVVLQAGLLSRTIDAVFLGGRDVAGVLPWLLGLLVAAVLRAASAWAGEALGQRAAGRVRIDLRTRLARHLMDLGPRYAAGERTGELAHTLVGGVEATDAYVSRYLPQLALAVVVPSIVLGFVAATDPLSGLVLALTFPLIPFFMFLLGGAARERTRQQWVTLARLSARFLDGLQGLATLKAFGRSREHTEAIAAASERFREITMGVLRIAFLSALALELLATLSTAIVAVEVGLRLLYARIAFQEALFVLILAPEFYRPLRALGASFHDGMAGTEAARRIFEVLDTPAPDATVGRGEPPMRAPTTRNLPRALALREPPQITFDHVRFAYEAGLPPALDASLHLDPGKTLALVGPSGAGKSTTAHLLLRFLEPQAGSIHVDGEPLATMPAETWRRQVAWVPQRPRLFHGTVLDNLCLARPEAPREMVEEAARRAHAHTFIRELPQGYDTPIGEDGRRLSDGQAQRLALARAFLKDAPVLVLDEPTSHLDPESEASVREAMARLLIGRTVLLIAHRLTTVRGADRIVLLSGGRVVEEGTHASLLVDGGRYARMVAAYEGRA
jgi:thiol reductant ABC exporter CydD subunit